MANGPLDDDLLETVRGRCPAPIAQAARRFQAAPEEACLTEALNLGQTLIYTLGTIALAWGRRRYVLPDGIRQWHEEFERGVPSLGHRLGAARSGAELARRLGTPLSGLEVALGGEDATLFAALAGMVNLRNRSVHDPPRSGTSRAAALDACGGHLQRALRGSTFLAAARFVIVEGDELQRDGSFRLTPFWIWIAKEHDGGWEIFYLDKRQGRRFEYTSLSRPGEKLLDSRLPKMLRWFEQASGPTGRYRIMRLVRDDFSLFHSRDVVETLWRRQLRAGAGRRARSSSTRPGPRPPRRSCWPSATRAGWTSPARRRRSSSGSSSPTATRRCGGTSGAWRWRCRRSPPSRPSPRPSSCSSRSWSGRRSATPTARCSAGPGSPGGTRCSRSRRNRRSPHTARVLLALRHCRQATDRRLGAPADELEPSVQWLLREPCWDNVLEEIERPVDPVRSEILIARHFTRAWAARALLEFEVDPYHERIRSTVGDLYQSHDEGLWDWSLPGQPVIYRPIWATLDALRLLRTYALRASPS